MRLLMTTARVSLFLLAAPIVAGCQTLGGSGLIQSSAQTTLTPESATAISDEMAARLIEHVGPGTATIQLQVDGSLFGQALETSLKSRGYAVATDQKASGTGIVPLAYTVDTFEAEVMVRLSTPSLTLTRIFAISAAGAAPISPLSVMTTGQGS